jgi:hypothetical protein
MIHLSKNETTRSRVCALVGDHAVLDVHGLVMSGRSCGESTNRRPFLNMYTTTATAASANRIACNRRGRGLIVGPAPTACRVLITARARQPSTRSRGSRGLAWGLKGAVLPAYTWVMKERGRQSAKRSATGVHHLHMAQVSLHFSPHAPYAILYEPVTKSSASCLCPSRKLFNK